jgi:hypothetical protein
VELCPQCGYSYPALARDEIAPELRRLASSYSDLLGRADVLRLRAHTQPDVWSALEYACHVRDVHRVQGARVLQALAEDQPDFAPMRREERVIEEHYNEQEPFSVAGQIRAAAGGLARTLCGLDEAGWLRTGVYHWPTTEVRTVDWIGRHTVHESVHHFQDIEELLKG